MSLIREQPRVATIRSLEPLAVMYLKGEYFRDLLQKSGSIQIYLTRLLARVITSYSIHYTKLYETKEPATDEAKKLVKLCYDKGLIILSCGNFGNVIRTLMPLVITKEQLERGLGILEACTAMGMATTSLSTRLE